MTHSLPTCALVLTAEPHQPRAPHILHSSRESGPEAPFVPSLPVPSYLLTAHLPFQKVLRIFLSVSSVSLFSVPGWDNGV